MFSRALPVFSNRTYLGTGSGAPVHTALSLDVADQRRGEDPLFQRNLKGDHLCGTGLQPGADTWSQRGRAPRNLTPVSGWSSDTLTWPPPPGTEASCLLCERRPEPGSLLAVTDAPQSAPQNFTHLEKLGGSQNYRVKSRFSTASSSARHSDHMPGLFRAPQPLKRPRWHFLPRLPSVIRLN